MGSVVWWDVFLTTESTEDTAFCRFGSREKFFRGCLWGQYVVNSKIQNWLAVLVGVNF